VNLGDTVMAPPRRGGAMAALANFLVFSLFLVYPFSGPGGLDNDIVLEEVDLSSKLVHFWKILAIQMVLSSCRGGWWLP
jgi:hypothetical protein